MDVERMEARLGKLEDQYDQFKEEENDYYFDIHLLKFCMEYHVSLCHT
jgi:hypothetical protein